jgi:selenocysteine-specific elongation factor
VLNNSRVHLYCGSDEVLCKVILLDRDALSAGETAYAQLRLEEPAAVRRGDRFIIRFYSPIITVGGGRIIDALPVKHKRNKPEILAGMDVLSKGTVSEVIYAKSCERRFVKQKELASELGMLGHEMAAATESGIANGSLVVLPDDTIVSDSKYERLKSDTESIINDYHADNPLADGIPRQELLSRLKARWFIDNDKLVQAVLKYLLAQGFIEDKGKSIAISGFSIEYTDEQKALKDRIKAMYAGAGIEMIKNDEVFALYKDGRIVRAILDDLESEGAIYKVNPSYYIDTKAWSRAVDTAMTFEDGFTLADYRDKLGTSRKYAVELLPAMDKAGITVFDGEKRRLLK